MSDSVVVTDSAPLISAKCHERLNDLTELTFTTTADSVEAGLINEENYAVVNVAGQWKEFVINSIKETDESDLLIDVQASLSSVELQDSIIEKQISSSSLSVLTAGVLQGTRWIVGTVESGIYSRSFTEDLQYMNVLEALFLLQKEFNCDIHFSYVVDGNKISKRQVNFYARVGANNGKRFEIDKDITSIEREIDTSQLATAIYPIQRKNVDSTTGGESSETIVDISTAVWKKSEGKPVDKPAGQKILVDPEALKQWGRIGSNMQLMNRVKLYEFNDEVSLEQMMQMSWVNLGKYTQPKVTYTAKVLDLYSLLGSEYLHEKVTIGDSSVIIDNYFTKPIRTEARITEIIRNLIDPTDNEIVLGDAKSDFTSNRSSSQSELANALKESYKANQNSYSALLSANGKNTNYFGSIEPSVKHSGDTWFRPHPDDPTESQMLQWDGTQWQVILDTKTLVVDQSIIDDVRKAAEDAQKAGEDAQKVADEAKKATADQQKILDEYDSAIKNANSKSDTAIADSTKAISDATNSLNKANEASVKADKAVKDAFDSTTIANQAKVDATNAVTKGNNNATEISKLDTEIKATATKVDGNTAEIAQVKVESGKLSTTVGKVETDLANLNTGNRNFFLDSNTPAQSSKGVYQFRQVKLAHNNGGYYYTDIKKDTDYTITVRGRGSTTSDMRFYVQNPDVYTLKNNFILFPSAEPTSIKSLTFRVPSTMSLGKGLTFGAYDMKQLGDCYFEWAVLTEGNRPVGYWFPAIEEQVSMKEYSTFEQSMKGFQTTVSSDLAGVKSQQTQMAGQISSTVETVNNLDAASTNLVQNSVGRNIFPREFGSNPVTHLTNVYVEEWKTAEARTFKGAGSTQSTFAIFNATQTGNLTTRKDFNYVWAIYIKNNHKTDVLKITNNINRTVTVEPLEVRRVVMTAKGNGTQYLQFNFQTEVVGGEVDFTYFQPMIAEGTVVSAWQPAPSDMASKTELLQTAESITSSVTATTDKLDVKTRIAGGLIMSPDPDFSKGLNEISTYNNAGNGAVTVNRESVPSGSQPTCNPYRLQVRTTAVASPAWGGIMRLTMSRLNAEFVIRFTALLPAGRVFQPANNSLGTGATVKWLTSNVGTGFWEEYIYHVKCGNSGTFSSFGHLYVTGGGTPTTANPLIWYLAKYEMIDITQSQQTRITQLSDSINATVQKVDGLDSKITYVDQKADSITSRVMTVEGGQASQASQITQLSNNIELRVEKGKVISQINLSPEVIRLDAKFIRLSGTSIIDSAVIKTAHLEDAAITNAKIGNLAVSEAKIGNLAVTTAKIANAAITNAKIGNLAVDTAKIADGAINNAKIQDATITNAKILNVDAGKIVTGYLDSNRIRAGSIAADKLAANAIQVGFNSMGSTIKISPIDLCFYSGGNMTGRLTDTGMEFWYGSRKIGCIGETYKTGNAGIRGIANNIESTGDFVTWGYKTTSTGSSYTAMLTLDPKGLFTGRKGINIDQDIYFNANIGIVGANQGLATKATTIGSQKLPALFNQTGQSGVAMSSTELYLIKNNSYVALSTIMKVVNALSGLGRIAIATGFSSDGTASSWYNITF